MLCAFICGGYKAFADRTLKIAVKAVFPNRRRALEVPPIS